MWHVGHWQWYRRVAQHDLIAQPGSEPRLRLLRPPCVLVLVLPALHSRMHVYTALQAAENVCHSRVCAF